MQLRRSAGVLCAWSVINPRTVSLVRSSTRVHLQVRASPAYKAVTGNCRKGLDT